MSSSDRTSSFDPSRTFVRVIEIRDDGFIELEFAVGEPELFVEMILPREAFEDFCAANRATVLATPEGAPESSKDWEWRLRDATHRRIGS